MDDAAFLASARLSPFKQMLTTLTSSRRNMGIAAGALGLVVLICGLAFCGGGSDKPKQVAAKQPDTETVAATPEPAPEAVEKAPPAAEPDAAIAEAAAPAGSGSGEPAQPSGPTPEELAAAAAADPAEPAPSGGSNQGAATTAATTTATTKRDTGKTTTTPKTTTTTTATTTTTTTATTTQPAKKDTLGGKQIVLEYDTQAREAKQDQSAISKARTAYAAGNQKLFAGDPAGAIKLYRQSLGFYPGYVAAYRGLGLAYAQQGDKTKALQALRTYVGTAPTAKDAPLIRKRITSLQGK